jgi:hypothetical protein
MNEIVTRGFENGIITRGFGRVIEGVVVYRVVSVCEPSIASHEYGELCIKTKELKPTMRTKTPEYYYEEIEI